MHGSRMQPFILDEVNVDLGANDPPLLMSSQAFKSGESSPLARKLETFRLESLQQPLPSLYELHPRMHWT